MSGWVVQHGTALHGMVWYHSLSPASHCAPPQLLQVFGRCSCLVAALPNVWDIGQGSFQHGNTGGAFGIVPGKVVCEASSVSGDIRVILAAEIAAFKDLYGLLNRGSGMYAAGDSLILVGGSL